MTVEQFWSLTPRELAVYFETALWKQQQERERDLWIAWHVAALSRARKLPPLAQLLKGKADQPSAEELARRKSEHEELIKRMVKRGE